MSRIIRSALALVTTLAVLQALTASASALTIAPVGAYNAAEANVTFNFPTTGQAIACAGPITKAFTMNANGTGTVAAGAALFNGCAHVMLGGVAVTQAAQWTVKIVLLVNREIDPIGVAMDITIPANGLRFSSPGCTFTASGTFRKLVPTAELPTVLRVLAVTNANITINGNNGGLLCGFFPVGLVVSPVGTLTLNQNMTVT